MRLFLLGSALCHFVRPPGCRASEERLQGQRRLSDVETSELAEQAVGIV